MKRYIIIFIFVFCSHLVFAQSFTFGDTHPVNNSDSLERWIAHRTKPTLERLKYLIALERTYAFENNHKRASQFDTIEKLAKSNNSTIGIVSLNYLKGLHEFTKYQPKKSISFLVIALNDFEKLHDISGQIHCNSTLSIVNYNSNNLIGDKDLANKYWSSAKLLLEQSNNIHDELIVRLRAIHLSYNTNDFNQFDKEVQLGVNIINKYPELQYGYERIKVYEAINYAIKKNFKQSANIYEVLLKNTNAKNYENQIRYNYNLGNDYLNLELYSKGIDAYKVALSKFAESDMKSHPCIRLIYMNYREYAQKHHDIKLANVLADSLMKYEKIQNDVISKKELVELESKNLLEKKEAEVQFLKRNQNTLFALLFLSII